VRSRHEYLSRWNLQVPSLLGNCKLNNIAKKNMYANKDDDDIDDDANDDVNDDDT
jgi:hypothetical protein